MIVNTLALLVLFVAAVEFATGGALLALGLRRRRAAPAGGAAAASSDRLVLLVAIVAGGLGAVGWLLWLFLLQSYVPQWEGVMCVSGVLRIGTGSLGATGWLPGLTTAASLLKPALVFAAGAVLVGHAARRHLPNAASLRPVRSLAIGAGLLAVADAAVATAYVVIPKTGRFLSAGCCSTAAVPEPGAGASPTAGLGAPGTLATVYLLLAAALAAGIVVEWRRSPRGPLLRAGLVVAALGVAVAGLAFAGGVVAPAHLGLPMHRCAFCLAADAPESLLGLALLALPAFALGWGAVARRLGPRAGAGERAPLDAPLLRAALFGTLGAALFLSVQWVAA